MAYTFKLKHGSVERSISELEAQHRVEKQRQEITGRPLGEGCDLCEKGAQHIHAVDTSRPSEPPPLPAADPDEGGEAAMAARSRAGEAAQAAASEGKEAQSQGTDEPSAPQPLVTDAEASVASFGGEQAPIATDATVGPTLASNAEVQAPAPAPTPAAAASSGSSSSSGRSRRRG